MAKDGIWGSPWSPAQHRASGTIIRLGLHRSLLHGPLIWQTTTSKLIRARLEGAALGMERCRLGSLPSRLSHAQPGSPGSLFSPQENRASERFTSKQLSTLFLPCFEAGGLENQAPVAQGCCRALNSPLQLQGWVGSSSWLLMPRSRCQMSPEDRSALEEVGYTPHPSALAYFGAQWLCRVLGTPWGCWASPGRDWAFALGCWELPGGDWALHWDAGHHLEGSWALHCWALYSAARHCLVLPGTAQRH